MQQTVKQRLIEFIKSKDLSQRRFETIVGLSNGYVNNISSGIGAAKFAEISKHFPDLNRDWLLTGEGEMLITDNAEPQNEYSTLLLPMSARGGSLIDFSNSAKREECEKVVSPIKGVDFAMTVTGESMAPEYPNGSRVFIKKINERAFIDWGRVYVLDTCNGAVIKKIMPGSTNDCVRCVSLNKEYPDFEVQFEDMYGMYRVLLLLTEK